MIIENIDWVAVLVAAVAGFGIGGIWFGPKTFYPVWVKAMGRNPEEDPVNQTSIGVAFGSTLVMMVLQSLGLAALMSLGVKAGIASDYGVLDGATLGAFVGVCFAAAASLSHRLFAGHNFKVWAIEVSGDIVALIVMGAVIAAIN